MADKKWSQFPSETPDNSDAVVGLHAGGNARFTVANIVAAVRQGLANLFVPNSSVGAANGVASLNGLGMVPPNQLPTIPSDAEDIEYNHTASGLSANDVQEAIDEVVDYLDNKQPKIIASGLLMGDGQGGVNAATPGTDYQAPLTIDATPTASSTNPVQSGGVYADVRTRVPNYGKGKNLLDNSYFVGGGTGRGVFPVNQRGQSSYTGLVYGIDRWESLTTGGTLTIGADYITLQAATYNFNWRQKLSRKVPLGSAVTLTVIKGDGSLVTGSGTLSSSTSFVQVALTSGYIRAYYDYVQITTGANSSNTIKEIWLELGTEQTLAHQEGSAWVPNEIPDYEYELYRCITSTADSSDTYANKSLATRQDLTNIQATGTTNTTGAAIPAGAYFYLNGVFYRAKTQIDVNATFTVNTNCEQATIGDQIKNVPFTLNTSGITQTDYNIRETQLRYIGSGFLIMWFNITCNTPRSDNVIVGNLPTGVPSPSAIITETYVSGAGTAVESMTVQIRTNRTVNCRYGHAGTGYTGTFVIPL